MEPEHIRQIVDRLQESVGVDVGVGPPDDTVGALDLLLGRVGVRVAVVVLAEGVLVISTYRLVHKIGPLFKLQTDKLTSASMHSLHTV